MVKWKFLVKLGKSRAKINKMLLTVYGEDALKPTTVYKWLKRFEEEHEVVWEDVRSGCPSSSHTKGTLD